MIEHEEAYQSTLKYFNNDELATSVFIDKYALRDDKDHLLEKNPDDMHRRMAKEIARIEKNKFKNPLSENEIYEYFKGFKRIVPQGSIMYGLGNHYKYITLGNCYTLEKPYDSISGILYVEQQLANLTKRRAGIGINLSNLRPIGTPTTNSSKTSSGITTFMEWYSFAIRNIAQGGRRAAGLLILDIHHPEILNFINYKKDLTKVTGANVSVCLTDEFLQAVDNNAEYEQRWPINSSTPIISNKINARKVWNEIIKSSWQCAEPGILIWSNIERETPSDYYEEYKVCGLNPCLPEWVGVYSINGYKTIRNVKVGDLIWSTEGWTKVINKIDRGEKFIYEYLLEDNTSFFCTQDHKIVSDGIKVSIKDASSIDKFDIIGQENKYTTVKIIGSKLFSCENVYDITVDNNSHTFWCNGFNVSNCGEQILAELDSCRLLLLNLYSYVKNPFTNNSQFDYDLFYNDVQIAQRLMDNIVDLELECIERVIKKVQSDPEPKEIKQNELLMWQKIRAKAKNGRRTGTGITGLGDCLAALNIGFGSEDSIQTTNNIYKTLKFGAYRTSIEIAKQYGSFVGYDAEKEKNCPYIQRFKDEELTLSNTTIYGSDILEDMKKYGRRNVTCLTTSPAGSVSILTQTTSGIEPVFQLKYTRRKKILSDGNVDFVDKTGDKWQHYEVLHSKLKDWMRITNETDIEKSPWITADKINWQNRVKLQAIAQKHIDSSLSSTVNIPNSATEQDVENIYLEAWKSGCKGITVYRDGCRDGILIKDKKSEKSDKTIRPRELECDVHHVLVNGIEYFTLVGLWEDGTPYEMFAGKNGCVNKKIKKGKIIRKRKNFYKFVSEDGDYELAPITGVMSDFEETISRLTSGLLRYNADINFIVNQLEKVGGTREELNNFGKCLARVLRKHYIKDHTPYDEEKCPDCGGNLVRIGGCPTCSCGYSKCL